MTPTDAPKKQQQIQRKPRSLRVVFFSLFDVDILHSRFDDKIINHFCNKLIRDRKRNVLQ